MKRIKIGVLGAGQMGSIHGRLIRQLKDSFELVGVYDLNQDRALQFSEAFNTPVFDSLEQLLEVSEAVDISTSTPAHFQLAMKALTAGKHCFIEKPLTATAQESKQLMDAVNKTNLVLMVGHVERFNPAFIAARDQMKRPKLIEAVRLTGPGSRGLDVPVVMDMMIHDLDLILSLHPKEVAEVRAMGQQVFTNFHDTVFAELTFEDGVLARLTASRAHHRKARLLTWYQAKETIEIDMLEQKAWSQVWSSNGSSETRPFYVLPNNAILEELRCFAQSIAENTAPPVTVSQGYRNVALAQRIVEALQH